MKFFSNNYFKDKEEEQDFFISLLVILFFGVGIVFFALPALNPPAEDIDPVADAVELLEEKDTTSLDNAGAVNIEAYVAKLKEENIEDTEILPIAKKVEATAAKAIPETIVKKVPQEEEVLFVEEEEEKTKPIQAKEDDRDGTAEVVEAAVEQVEKEPVQPIAKPIVANTIETKKCTVMIGAFKNALNAELLKQRLANDGYQIYEETRGKFNLVGVKASCNPTKLENVLLVMRSNYSADAFILEE